MYCEQRRFSSIPSTLGYHHKVFLSSLMVLWEPSCSCANKAKQRPSLTLDSSSKELTSTSRLTTPVDLLLGFFLRWLEGCNDDGEAEPEAVLVVTLVPELDEVIVTDGTSTFSAIDQYCLSYNAVQQHPYEKRSMGEREREEKLHWPSREMRLLEAKEFWPCTKRPKQSSITWL